MDPDKLLNGDGSDADADVGGNVEEKSENPFDINTLDFDNDEEVDDSPEAASAAGGGDGDADADAGDGEAEPAAVEAEAEADPPAAETPAASETQEEGVKAEEAKAPEAEVAPAVPPVDMAQLAQQYQEWRTEAENILATQHFRLSEEQVEELQDSPETAIPKLISKAYIDVVSTVMTQIASTLPQMINLAGTQTQQTSAMEEEFFSAWPQLREHQDTVVRIGEAFRQRNPTAPKDAFVREVGASAMVALQLPLEVPAQRQQQPQQKPFRPAAGNRRPAAPKSESSNPFVQMSEEVLREDLSDMDL